MQRENPDDENNRNILGMLMSIIQDYVVSNSEKSEIFPYCMLPPSMTPKPLVKLIMHLRMLEFFSQV